MINLLHETVAKLDEYGFTPEDVRWVGSRDGKVCDTWINFVKLANREYDNSNGYDGQEVLRDLVIVGNTGWWLERREHDYFEWWEFKSLPIPAIQNNPLTAVFRDNCVED